MSRASAPTLALCLSFAVHAALATTLFFPRLAGVPTGPEKAPSEAPPSLAGQSFELPAPESTSDVDEPTTSQGAPSGAEATAAATDARQAREATTAEGARPKPASAAGKNARDKPTSTPGTAGTDSAGGATTSLYGAAGDRSAVDLATAITRAFPQAASSDAAWVAAPMGPAGDVTIGLTLDDSGKLVASEIGPGATPALAAGIRRTLALVGGRAFTSHGKVTRLRLVATVSPDTVHDGLHGDVFAIGGSYTGNEGLAFFALAIGRRVDLKVSPR